MSDWKARRQFESRLWYCPLCSWSGELGKLIRHSIYGCAWHCPNCYNRQPYAGICDADRLGCVPSEHYSNLDFMTAPV